MENQRFVILSDKPGTSGMGKIYFGDVSGYECGSRPTIEEAKMYCSALVSIGKGPLRVIDWMTFKAGTVDVVYTAG